MKLLLFSFFVWVLLGCECDSICEANRATKKLLNGNASNEEIINYLNEYKGEAPGAATYGAFVNWRVENSKRFVAILNHHNITKRNLDLVVYKIADYGNHAEFCETYKDLTVHKNDNYIRNRLLGCNYGL